MDGVITEVLVLGMLISILPLTDRGGFRDRGAAPPLRPRPLGMLVVNKFVTLTDLFLFLTDRNCGIFLFISATATECEQIPIAFQLGQLESQLKSPPFFGVTKWETLPL